MSRGNHSFFRRRHIVIFVFVFFVGFMVCPKKVLAQHDTVNAVTAPDEKLDKNALKNDGPVELNGDRVEFNNSENKFDAQGHVVVSRGDTKIYADAMQFYRQEKIAIA